MAGVASNIVSVNQQPQYGDQKQLADMKTTTTPMSGSVVPAPTAGRPPSQDQPAPQGQPQPQSAVPPEHQSAMGELAQATRTRDFWNNVLQQYPSAWSRMYAAAANRAYQEAAITLREQTPFFHGV